MCLDEVCLIGLLCSLTGFILRWGGEQNPLHLIYHPICQISVHSFSRVSESRGLLLSLEPSWSIYSWLHSLFYFTLLSSELCHPGICWTLLSADGSCPLRFLRPWFRSLLYSLTFISVGYWGQKAWALSAIVNRKFWVLRDGSGLTTLEAGSCYTFVVLCVCVWGRWKWFLLIDNVNSGLLLLLLRRMSWRQILESDCVWFELAGGGEERVGDQWKSQENEVCDLSLKEHVFEKKEKVSVKYHRDVK